MPLWRRPGGDRRVDDVHAHMVEFGVGGFGYGGMRNLERLS